MGGSPSTDRTRVVKKARSNPKSSISDMARMLSAGNKAEERVFREKREPEAQNACQEAKRKKIEPEKRPKQSLLAFSRAQPEKRKNDDTCTLVQKEIPKRQKPDGQDGLGIGQLDCSTHKGIS